MWPVVFAAGNGLALLCWALLIAGPRNDVVRSVVIYFGVALLSLAYLVLLALLLSGLVGGGGPGSDQPGGFTSIAGVRALFASDGGITLGWLHYLALDLFAGMWIARDADAKGFGRVGQGLVLALTFIAGPVGLLVWLTIREPAARRAALRADGPRSRVKQ